MAKCPKCNKGGIECPKCKGKGSTSTAIKTYPCGHCSGSGVVKCGVCNGTGKI
jgi:hypothetical protein